MHALSRRRAGFVLTGMGSSFDACLAAASVLARRGAMATTVNTAELLHFRTGALSAATPVLAVSQSGQQRRAACASPNGSARLKQRPPLVTLTNGLANPLADLADIAFDTAAGIETCTVDQDLRRLPGRVAGARRRHRRPGAVRGGRDAARRRRPTPSRAAAAAARLLRRRGRPRRSAWRAGAASDHWLVVLGRGTARAAAEMGALILKEAAARHAESLDTAEFRHGPLELSGPDLAAAIVSTEPATLRARPAARARDRAVRRLCADDHRRRPLDD